MFDVCFPSGQASTEGPTTVARRHGSGLALDTTETPGPWDDSVLMAEPDGDVIGWDDDEEEDELDDDDPDLADEFDDDDD